MHENTEIVVGCYTRANFIGDHANEDAYRIFQLVSGTGIILLEKRLSVLAAGDLVFLKPGSKVIWCLPHRSVIHHCKVRSSYFEQYPYMTKSFKQDSLFNFNIIVRNLPPGQAATIGMLFQMIRDEVEGPDDDKKEAILIHLQMMLLLTHRVGHRPLQY